MNNPSQRASRPRPVAPESVWPGPKSADQPDAQALALLRRLIWLYFVLLLAEGALRKWFLPQLSVPLLVARDPIVLAIYYLAIKQGVFPRNGFITWLIGLAFLCVPLGLFQIASGATTVPVLLYGLRTNFFHVPLIFLMPLVLSHEDVRRFGKWFLLLSLPMAALMVVQFNAPHTAWINRTVSGDEGAFQLASAMGRIRPPGVFSFVTGVVSFYGLVAAFLFAALSQRRSHSPWTLLAGGGGLVVAMAVSGSRSAILGVVVVSGFFLLGQLLAGRIASGVLKLGAVSLLLLVVVSQTRFFAEGLQVLVERWQTASEFEAEGGGLLGRFLYNFTSALGAIEHYPLLGCGIGRGTNVGAKLLTGSQYQFLLAEGEWGRILGECGPIVGGAVILYRFVLAGWLGVLGLRAARAGNVLPLALFGACGLDVINGQFGPATSLGFVVVGAGLSLAAINPTPEELAAEEEEARLAEAAPPPRRTRRRPFRFREDEQPSSPTA